MPSETSKNKEKPLRERDATEILNELRPYKLPGPESPGQAAISEADAVIIENPTSIHGWAHQDFNERREGEYYDD